MELNLRHEDLLIKLRSKLNDEKIKLWEPPYFQADNVVSHNLQELAKKYSTALTTSYEDTLTALQELQTHSIDRSKANAEFQETGVATIRVKATGERAQTFNVMKRLDVPGSELIGAVAEVFGVVESRVKLIFNGKVIKATPNIQEQGVKNGVQVMALVMAETPEQVKKEDTMYMEMKATRDDATLLSECVDDGVDDDDDEYMKLEDQSGATVELPAAERRSLLVGLALHERGRAAIKQHDYPLALVLLLEADRQFSECRSSLLSRVDNVALLQLDVSWCYVCLRALQHATDAARRLALAERAFSVTYGERGQRLMRLKGTVANERVLFMRLYLLQGIVAFHQNKRGEARALLEKAELEMNALRVDEGSVSSLLELGWSVTQARFALRATQGDVDRAHHYLEEQKKEKHLARQRHREDRQKRLLGVCSDGSAVSGPLVSALTDMGFRRRSAVAALRHCNNHVADAVRLIQDQPELLEDTESSSEETEIASSDTSLVEPDHALVAELVGMGYECSMARAALSLARNCVSSAIDILHRDDPSNPSTSAATSSNKRKSTKHTRSKKKKEREAALARLTSSIQTEDNDHLDTTLTQEEELLALYKSLL